MPEYSGMNSPLELSLSIYCRESINNWLDLGYIKVLTVYGERRRVQPELTGDRSEYAKESKTRVRATVKVGEKKPSGS